MGSTLQRFDEFVDTALYHPETGFYSASGHAGGARGDFITSPEVGPLFGAVLARALDQWWIDQGRPDPYRIVEVGSGPGTLLRSILAAEPACAVAWELTSVERSARQRQLQSDLVTRGVAVRPDLGEVTGAVVIANEVLDNVPFRVVERDATGWLEWYVDPANKLERRPAELPAWFAAPGVAPSEIVPLLEGARALVGDILAAEPARLVAFDYGTATTAELAARGGWLRTYAAHRRGSDPFAAVGQTDITTDICVDQLPGQPVVMSQARFLKRWGIEELVAQGRAQWEREAARPTVGSLLARSRVREAEALCAPDGLGGFLALQWPAGEAR